MTISDFQSLFPKMSRRTLQRDIRALMEKGLIRRQGRTTGAAYILADEPS